MTTGRTITRRARRQAAAAVVLGMATAAAAVGPAAAVPLQLTFDSADQSIRFSNHVLQGVRLSPSCNFSVVGSGGVGGSPWLGFDGSGCLDGRGNDGFIGPPVSVGEAAVTIDAFGVPFALSSIYFVDPSVRVLSSAGGLFIADQALLDAGGGRVVFSGDRWSSLDWLLLVSDDLGLPSGVDDVILDVPRAEVSEPPTPALLGLGLLAALGLRAGRRRLSTLSDRG